MRIGPWLSLTVAMKEAETGKEQPEPCLYDGKFTVSFDLRVFQQTGPVSLLGYVLSAQSAATYGRHSFCRPGCGGRYPAAAADDSIPAAGGCVLPAELGPALRGERPSSRRLQGNREGSVTDLSNTDYRRNPGTAAAIPEDSTLHTGSGEAMLDWECIDVVLLDMDGTLLDLHFDDYFWREHLPRRFSEKSGIPFEQAREQLFERYREMRGRLEWYCVDYWSRELDMDIPVLKEEVEHLIAVHPHVPEFLDRIRAAGKRAFLVTNAHGKSLALKMRRTRIGERLDGLVCAHDLGLPKEDPAFWDKLRGVVPFDNNRTLLVDDNLEVLASARMHGIRFLVSVIQPSTRRAPRLIEGFMAIRSFFEILP